MWCWLLVYTTNIGDACEMYGCDGKESSERFRQHSLVINDHYTTGGSQRVGLWRRDCDLQSYSAHHSHVEIGCEFGCFD